MWHNTSVLTGGCEVMERQHVRVVCQKGKTQKRQNQNTAKTRPLLSRAYSRAPRGRHLLSPVCEIRCVMVASMIMEVAALSINKLTLTLPKSLWKLLLLLLSSRALLLAGQNCFSMNVRAGCIDF